MMESGSNLVEQPFFAVKNEADHWALTNVDLLESEILLSVCVDATRSCTLLHFGLFSWFDNDGAGDVYGWSPKVGVVFGRS